MLCFSMVFVAFVEFAFISFIGIFIKRMKMNDLVRILTLRQMTRCATSPIMELTELMDDPEVITTNSSSESVPLIGEEVPTVRPLVPTILLRIFNEKYFN